jgi:type VI protein secretion system component VasK
LVRLEDYLRPFLELVLAVIFVVLVPVFLVYFAIWLNLGIYSWIPIGTFVTIVVAWFYHAARKKAAKEYGELRKPALLKPIDESVEEYKRLIEESEE